MYLLNFHKTSMYIAVAPAEKYHKSEYFIKKEKMQACQIPCFYLPTYGL